MLLEDARSIRARAYSQTRRDLLAPTAVKRSNHGSPVLEYALRPLFGDVTHISDSTALVHVADVRLISWAAVDQALRTALTALSWPGVMLVAVDDKRVVLFEALVLFSRREDVTRMTEGQRARKATHEWLAQHEIVELRPERT